MAVVGHNGAIAITLLRSWREEQLALAGGAGGGRRAARLAVAGETGGAAADERGVRVEVRVLVELGRRREGPLVAVDGLGHGGALDGTVQETGDNGAPDHDSQTKCAEDGADADEDGTVGERRVLHERRILRGRNGRRGIGWDNISGESWKTG